MSLSLFKCVTAEKRLHTASLYHGYNMFQPLKYHYKEVIIIMRRVQL